MLGLSKFSFSVYNCKTIYKIVSSKEARDIFLSESVEFVNSQITQVRTFSEKVIEFTNNSTEKFYELFIDSSKKAKNN